MTTTVKLLLIFGAFVGGVTTLAILTASPRSTLVESSPPADTPEAVDESTPRPETEETPSPEPRRRTSVAAPIAQPAAQAAESPAATPAPWLEAEDDGSDFKPDDDFKDDGDWEEWEKDHGWDEE
jgi:hypothetical protein